ncbi:hypothetical protein D9O50_14120 [Oxalobacteraceae bacterium CAVE-383]|nr:hypothetical protein D9O50_14120 [Oxalobacteraceae bacterium CAVE-383]
MNPSFALTASHNVSYAWPSANTTAAAAPAPMASRAMSLAPAGSHLINSRSYRYTRHAEARAEKPIPDVPRPRRDTSDTRRGETGPHKKIFADFAEKIGMPAQALRDDPARGLKQLFRRFGPAVLRADPMPTLSTHAIQIGRHDFSAWCELFGDAASKDDEHQTDALPNLLNALQDFAIDLLQSRHGGRKRFQTMLLGNFVNALRQGSEAAALKAAIAKDLRNARHADSLSETEAYWYAKLILCKYEPSLGRMDAPDSLALGSLPQLHRELAILARTAGHASHWTLSENSLLKNPPPPGASREAYQSAGLKFAYAQGRDYLPPLPDRGWLDIDSAIPGYAIEDLRESLDRANITSRLLPPGAGGLDALADGWVERIDWIAFDGPDFLLTLGAEAPYRNTLEWWMRAIRDGFQLGTAFDAEAMDGARRRRFVARVAASQAFGDDFGNEGDLEWDRGFVQSLFNAFLRHYIGPLAQAPFERALWRATEPLRFLQCNDPAVSPGLTRTLRSVREVLEDIRRELFRHGAQRGAMEEQQWIVRFLSSLYAPALANAALPDQMAYGGADHVAMELLSLYPGLPRNLTMETARRLLDRQSLMEIMKPIAVEESNPVLEASPLLLIVRRMAHAHGVIDAGRGRIGLDGWEKALRHFEKLAPAESAQGDIFFRGVKMLVGRTQSIRNLLYEMQCDPDQSFSMPPPPSPYLSLWIRQPLAFGKPHTLAEIVMDDAFAQMLAHGDLSDRDIATLQQVRDRWPKEKVLSRCREDFDRSFDALIQSQVMPALRRLVQTLDADDQRFWQCGLWTLRRPRATLEVTAPHGALTIPVYGNYGNGAHRINLAAGGAVLIDLTLDNETRHYWASLRPAGIARYSGSEAELIREHLHTFFPADAADSGKRKILGFVSIRNFYSLSAGNGENILSALVKQAFPAKEVERLYRKALGETDAERVEAFVRDFILGMLPGYECWSAVTTPGRLQTASVPCTLDAAGALLPLKIGGKALAKVANVGRRALLAEAMAARLGAASAGRTFRMAIMEAYPVFSRAAKEILLCLDPGVTGTVMLWRLGKSALAHLKNSIGHIAELQGWRSRIDNVIRMRDAVFPQRGVWQAVAQALKTDAGGNRYLAIGHARYGVADLDDIADVLVIPAGGGRVRPVNPETGLPCGFAQRPAGMVRIDKPPGSLQMPAAMLKHCRPRRAPAISFTSCAIVPAPHLGPDYYSMPDTGTWQLYQKASDGRETLLEIDPSSIAYRSYAAAGEQLPESDLFLHDGILYRRLNNGHLLGMDWGLKMDKVIYGSVSHEKYISMNGESHGKAWYVRAKVHVDRTAQGDGMVTMVCMAPYSDVTDAQGMPLRIATLFGRPYVFKGGDLPRRNQKFKLRRAAPAHTAVQNLYGKINGYDYPEAIAKTILRLYDEPRFRSAIDTTLQRFDTMLANARRYYALPEANRFLRKFVPDGNPDLAEQFRQRLCGQLEQIENAMPHLKAHKDRLIAVADLKASGGDLALSLNRAMAYPLDSSLLNKPVLIIDQTELATRPVNVIAAYLGHELTHAVLGTLDTMAPGSSVQFYATLKRGGDVDISMLRFGAQVPGLDPAICASVVEHCLSVGDGMARGDERVRDIVEGDSSIYNRHGDGFDRRRRETGDASGNPSADPFHPSDPFEDDEWIADVDVMTYILISAFPPEWLRDEKKKR